MKKSVKVMAAAMAAMMTLAGCGSKTAETTAADTTAAAPAAAAGGTDGARAWYHLAKAYVPGGTNMHGRGKWNDWIKF